LTSDSDRERMLDLLMRRGIEDERVLAAMRAVPRHLFVDAALVGQAYADGPLPIGEGQTISQPFIVALMTQALRLRRGERVLEIGSGSGYQAAVLAEMGMRVFSVERCPTLAERARRLLASLGYQSVAVRCGDGNEGWVEEAPFDAVLITAAAREVPRAPYAQLRMRGRMLLPLGDEEEQELALIDKTPEGPREVCLGSCRFVKLIGRHGWAV